uniref:Uncharacterized protein n=1 Tax=Anguilla anguilla TaxID=7936 RepID=A0A0E9PB70_ANGAN
MIMVTQNCLQAGLPNQIHKNPRNIPQVTSIRPCFSLKRNCRNLNLSKTSYCIQFSTNS